MTFLKEMSYLFFEAEGFWLVVRVVPLSAQMQLPCFRSHAAKLHNRCNRGYFRGFGFSWEGFYAYSFATRMLWDYFF